jgi:parallel beta-helix repeat protein
VGADTFRGTGIRITGRGITLRGARVHGYRCGIHAAEAPGLLIEDCDLSGNFRQRLKSTPQAEDASGGDWLWPHANDNHEWLTNYGAGLYIEDSAGVTVRRVRAREGQNGIILDRVTDSRVYDTDCSFLSGWGLALWRSSGNIISRNAFDFCVRGYSHGVYNRGQDSAGILMFEQCSRNIIAENSATHGGDGLFIFAGREALGEPPEAPPEAAQPPATTQPPTTNNEQRTTNSFFRARGCNGNRILNNDFSYAAAHGLEVTFSFDNVVRGNTFRGNAICGLWGGYSSSTRIESNTFEANGEAGYGSERGGINIEHGCDSIISKNTFRRNACGVHLWWDDDESLLRLPWARENDTSAARNQIIDNRFEGDALAIQLRQAKETLLSANLFTDVGRALVADEQSRATLRQTDEARRPEPFEALDTVLGETRPVGARSALHGRERIVMTEWGPYDWAAPLLQRTADSGAAHEYRLLGPEPIRLVSAAGPVLIVQDARQPDRFTIRPADAAARGVLPYTARVMTPARTLEARGVLAACSWSIRIFPSVVDPRVDADRWRREGLAGGAAVTAPRLELVYGHGGASELKLDPLIERAALPRDHFGTIASAIMAVPAGRWRLRTLSDDGLRVWLDGELVIDDWTHHGPTAHEAAFALEALREIELRVEHFELDGYAVLRVVIEPMPDDPDAAVPGP